MAYYNPSLRRAQRGFSWEPKSAQEVSQGAVESNLALNNMSGYESKFAEHPIESKDWLAQGQELVGTSQTLMQKIADTRLANTIEEAQGQVRQANRQSNQAWTTAQNEYSNAQGQYKAQNNPMFSSFKNASPEFMAFAQAISGQESGGSYGVTNADTGAMGRYQVLPSHIAGKGGWDEQILGRSITPEKYLNTPRLQDKIALGMMRGMFREHGVKGAASEWYSGDPENWRSTSDQGGYPSIREYVGDISQAYKQNLQRILSHPTKRQQGMQEMSGLNHMIDPLKGKGSWDLSSEQDYGSRSIGQGWHTGIDLAASMGTPIYAATSGKIVKADYDEGYGNQVFIRTKKGKTTYSHMLDYAPGIRNKGWIKKGQIIGYVGDTGTYSQGPHLHFETYKKGKERNPMKFLRRSGVVP